MKSYSDEELWHLSQDGDRRAFETLYHRYARLLFHEISRRIDVLDKVEDLIQDIFLSLWEKRGSYQLKGEIYPYLYGMAVNRVLNYYRTNRLTPKFVEIWDNLPEERAELEELSAAFREAHSKELESLVDQAISALPPRMRQVYKLRYEENKTVPEVASFLSTSPNTVRNQLKAIRKRFVQSLRKTSFLLVLVKSILTMLLNH